MLCCLGTDWSLRLTAAMTVPKDRLKLKFTLAAADRTKISCSLLPLKKLQTSVHDFFCLLAMSLILFLFFACVFRAVC